MATTAVVMVVSLKRKLAVGTMSEVVMTPPFFMNHITGKYAGATYMVLRHGKIAAQAAIGKQDIEKNLTMTMDTIFRLYSQSKPLANAGFLTLIDKVRPPLLTPLPPKPYDDGGRDKDDLN